MLIQNFEFLCLFLEDFVWIFSNFKFLLQSQLFTAFLYEGFALLSSSSLIDNDERRVFPILDNCFEMGVDALEIAFS